MNLHFFHVLFRNRGPNHHKPPPGGEGSLLPMHRLVWTALLAALVAVGAYLQLSFWVVPFSLQTFFVLLAGFVLGPLNGSLAVLLYIVAGAVGLPVFAAGKGGLGHILGPTGGYIIGFAFGACAAGVGRVLCRRDPLPWTCGIATAALALVPIYALGLPWLKYTLDVTWPRVVAIGLVPFLPGDLVKVMAVVAVYRYLQEHDLVKL